MFEFLKRVFFLFVEYAGSIVILLLIAFVGWILVFAIIFLVILAGGITVE